MDFSTTPSWLPAHVNKFAFVRSSRCSHRVLQIPKEAPQSPQPGSPTSQGRRRASARYVLGKVPGRQLSDWPDILIFLARTERVELATWPNRECTVSRAIPIHHRCFTAAERPFERGGIRLFVRLPRTSNRCESGGGLQRQHFFKRTLYYSEYGVCLGMVSSLGAKSCQESLESMEYYFGNFCSRTRKCSGVHLPQTPVPTIRAEPSHRCRRSTGSQCTEP